MGSLPKLDVIKTTEKLFILSLITLPNLREVLPEVSVPS